MLFPLPGGEGQGEGKGTIRFVSGYRFNETAIACRGSQTEVLTPAGTFVPDETILSRKRNQGHRFAAIDTHGAPAGIDSTTPGARDRRAFGRPAILDAVAQVD